MLTCQSYTYIQHIIYGAYCDTLKKWTPSPKKHLRSILLTCQSYTNISPSLTNKVTICCLFNLNISIPKLSVPQVLKSKHFSRQKWAHPQKRLRFISIWMQISFSLSECEFGWNRQNHKPWIGLIEQLAFNLA